MFYPRFSPNKLKHPGEGELLQVNAAGNARALTLIALSLLLLVIAAGTALLYPWQDSGTTFSLDLRPSTSRSVYDYAGILTDSLEATENYLRVFKEDYGIDAIVVSLPASEQGLSISELAAKLFSKWEIGRGYHDRGLLLLLVDQTKEVKLEVSYELEDVFTDLFTGYIEDLQLKPYFLSGGLAQGLVAVMEEMENRAHLKQQKNYTPSMVAEMDRELLSGGGGAKRELNTYQHQHLEKLPWTSSELPGGRTPQEAWEIMLSKGLGKKDYLKRDIYSESTKLATNDDQNNPDPRIKKLMPHWDSAKYQVISKGNYAVIFFGKKDGWNNAPTLFARTKNGWKFDIVSQRKWITMGRAPKWGIQRADHPYVSLLSRASYWMNKDIDLQAEDRYEITKDRAMVARILELENKVKNKSANDFASLLELGRLGTITARRPQYVVPRLNKAIKLNPPNPLPYKYLAIYHVRSSFQYKTALRNMEKYAQLRPGDLFAGNFLGYLYFQLKDYDAAAEKFHEVLQSDPDNLYALCKLSRTYALQHLKANRLNPRASTYQSKSLEMLDRASKLDSGNKLRVKWLKSWLKKRNILE